MFPDQEIDDSHLYLPQWNVGMLRRSLNEDGTMDRQPGRVLYKKKKMRGGKIMLWYTPRLVLEFLQ